MKTGIEMLARKLESSRKLKYSFFAAAFALALLLFLTSGSPSSCSLRAGTGGGSEEKPRSTQSDPADAIEKKLEAALGRMRGVGAVSVMVTLDKTAEQIVASNEKRTSAEKSESAESRPATVQSGGREEPIVVTEVLPKVRGVIVIAEGAADLSVKYSIEAAVSTVLGIDENSVEVFVMAG